MGSSPTHCGVDVPAKGYLVGGEPTSLFRFHDRVVVAYRPSRLVHLHEASSLLSLVLFQGRVHLPDDPIKPHNTAIQRQ